MELEGGHNENRWNLLQQPVSPSSAVEPRCRLLLSALDQGWVVEEPVYFRPRWSEDGAWVFHFILKHRDPERTQLLTVSPSPQIEGLISEEGWRLEVPKRSLAGSGSVFRFG
jgi:hypothetical protein